MIVFGLELAQVGLVLEVVLDDLGWGLVFEGDVARELAERVEHVPAVLPVACQVVQVHGLGSEHLWVVEDLILLQEFKLLKDFLPIDTRGNPLEIKINQKMNSPDQDFNLGYNGSQSLTKT